MQNPFRRLDTLISKHFELRQSRPQDFEPLLSVASDPKVWEQHPEKDRWRREKFQRYFDGALSNLSPSYTIIDRELSRVMGASRYYDFDAKAKSVRVGYTFIAREYWGTSANREIKTAMLAAAFKLVDTVYFDIGPNNFRSRRAVEKIGAEFSHAEDENKVVYVLDRNSCTLDLQSVSLS